MRRMLGLAMRSASVGTLRARSARRRRAARRGTRRRGRTRGTAASSTASVPSWLSSQKPNSRPMITESPSSRPTELARQRVVGPLGRCGPPGRTCGVGSRRFGCSVYRAGILRHFAAMARRRLHQRGPGTTREIASVNRRALTRSSRQAIDRVRSIDPRRCARGETNIASNWDGGRNTPRSRMPRKNAPNRAVSAVFAVA